MALNKSLGAKVAEARKRVSPKMSQAELAKRLKDSWPAITPAEIAQIEAGNRSLNVYQVTMLASALKTTAHQLLS